MRPHTVHTNETVRSPERNGPFGIIERLADYMLSGTVTLNMVSTLAMTCFTARHRARRA